MNELETLKARRLPDGAVVEVSPDGATGPLVGGSDCRRLGSMPEEEIDANARADPDTPPLTPEALVWLHLISDPGAIRRRLNLMRKQFAARFGVTLGTPRDWEQGVHAPDSTARTLLRVIDRHPEAVIDALGR